MSDTYPWIEYPDIWPTQPSFMAWVRGGLRRGLWEKHPVKLQFLNSQKIPMENTNPRSKKRYPTVPGLKCAICGGLFRTTQAQVDHLCGNHPLKTMDDLQTFTEAMIMVKTSDLQIVCKPCHKIKSYAERMEISFEEAKAIKQAIEICKTKQDKQFLIEHGVKPATNAAKRRTQVEEVLKEEQ
ncbi:hypothetical protein D3C75_640240 [compost metagenome]